jgi:peptide/nickel transport system permease protein
MIARSLRALRGLFRRSLAISIGLPIVALFVVALVVWPVAWPFGPDTIDANRVLAFPSLRHPLGTDGTGRDVLARVVNGTRYAFAVPVAALLVGIGLGAPLGLLAGLAGGFADLLMRRTILAVGFIPPLLLALALVAAMGPSLRHVVLTIGVLESFVFARAMRDEVRAMRDSGFIEGMVAAGNSLPRLVLVHLLPNTLASIAGEIPRRIAAALGTLAVMGFVGIGTAADSTEWGAMVREGVELLYAGQWWPAIFPGLALLTLGFGLRLLAAGIADLTRGRSAAITWTNAAAVPGAPAGAWR